MTNAPERIWARDHAFEPDWTADPDVTTTDHVEYIRKDVSDDLIAEAREGKTDDV